MKPEDNEMLRRFVWLSAWCTAAHAAEHNATRADHASGAANKAVAEFDKTFPPPRVCPERN